MFIFLFIYFLPIYKNNRFDLDYKDNEPYLTKLAITNENFDVFLEKAIKNDLSLYKANKDDNTFVISKMVTSTNMLYETISDMLIKLKLGDISKDNDFFSLFYRKLYILKDGENYAIKYKTNTTLIKVSINYHKNEKSIIKIEKENFTNN